MMTGAISVILNLWLFLALATPLGLSALWPFLSRRTAAGMLFAPLVGWALLTYILWILGFVGVPFHASTIWILLLASCIGGLALLAPRRERLFAYLSGARWTLLVGILVFLVAFFYLVQMRVWRPDINGQEKFMDLAFYNSLRVHGDIPPLDPWLSGYTINYYYGGYMMAAVAGKAMGIPPGVAYNLNLCLLYALAAMGAFTLTAMLTARKGWGVFSAVWIVLSGNMLGAWQVLGGAPLKGIEIWAASRVIVDNGETINEFPIFSFGEVGDMHPHMMALPLAFVMLFLAYAWIRRTESQWRLSGGRGTMAWLVVLSGLWLAIMGWTNIFDVATYGLFLFTAVFLFRLSTAPRWSGVIVPGVMVAVTGGLALLFLAPFLLTYHPPQSGKVLDWVPYRSDLGEYLLMWGMHAAVAAVVIAAAAWRALLRWKGAGPQVGGTLAAVLCAFFVLLWTVSGYVVFALLWTALIVVFMLLFSAARRWPSQFAWAGLFFALCVLIGCEMVYLVDNYGVKRGNTLFKFFYPTWVIAGTLLPVLLASALRRFRLGTILGVGVPLAALFAGTLLYPLSLTLQRRQWHHMAAANVLDGARYMAKQFPADAAVVDWLRREADPYAVVLERPGHLGYTRESRISVHSGRPALIGWLGHEQVWRGQLGVQQSFARAADAEIIYTTPDFEKAWPLIVKHRINYIVVSLIERTPVHDNNTGQQTRWYPKEGLDKFEREAGRAGGRLRRVLDYVGPSGVRGGADSGRIYEVVLPGEAT